LIERAGEVSDAAAAIADIAGGRQRGIDRTVDLFEALRREGRPMRIGDLAARIGAPRSSVYEIVNRMIGAQLFEMTDGGRVYFGRAMFLYGRAYADANPFYLRGREVLERLTLETNETSQLCAMQGHRCVVLDERVGHSISRIATKIGVEIPLPWTASGRLLVDHLEPDAIKALIPAGDFGLPDGAGSPERFLGEVVEARRNGRFDNELPGRLVHCLAAPIRDAQGIASATLCFVVALGTEPARCENLLEILVFEASRLAQEL
jgi:DNA-binding IclR family transcriptional regulator